MRSEEMQSPPLAKHGRRRGRRGRTSRVGGRALLTMALVVPLTACATKGDLRDLQEQIRAIAARQEAALARLEVLMQANRDSLGLTNDELVELRGEINRQLLQIQDQLVTVQELTGQGQRNLAAMRDQLEQQRSRISAPPPAAGADSLPGGDEPAAETGPVDQSAGGAESLYNAAVGQFNRGSFVTARRGFERFLQQFPNHTLAADAHYFLAEILVQEERFEEAIEGFLRIPEVFPTSDRVPRALYRVGVLNLDALEDADEARIYLERVVNSYPDSGVADLARERLREIN